MKPVSICALLIAASPALAGPEWQTVRAGSAWTVSLPGTPTQATPEPGLTQLTLKTERANLYLHVQRAQLPSTVRFSAVADALVAWTQKAVEQVGAQELELLSSRDFLLDGLPARDFVLGYVHNAYTLRAHVRVLVTERHDVLLMTTSPTHRDPGPEWRERFFGSMSQSSPEPSEPWAPNWSPVEVAQAWRALLPAPPRAQQQGDRGERVTACGNDSVFQVQAHDWALSAEDALELLPERLAAKLVGETGERAVRSRRTKTAQGLPARDFQFRYLLAGREECLLGRVVVAEGQVVIATIRAPASRAPTPAFCRRFFDSLTPAR